MMAVTADEPVAAAAVSEGVTTPPVAEAMSAAAVAPVTSMPAVASMATAHALDVRLTTRLGEEVNCPRGTWHWPRLGDS